MSALHAIDDTAAPEPTPEEREARFMAGLAVWVDLWLGRIVERRTSNRRRWCGHWREHPEVVVRLRALYAGWLQVTRDGDALAYSTWILDHLDKHLDRMLDAEGPFNACSPERHIGPRRLAVDSKGGE